MKELLFIAIFSLGFVFPQETKLSGRYFVDFKNDNFQTDGYIDFYGESFTMKHYNLLPYSGTINYYKTLTSLQSSSSSDIVIDFQTNEIGKDSIKFQVHSKKSAMNYLDISVNSGTFIKVR